MLTGTGLYPYDFGLTCPSLKGGLLTTRRCRSIGACGPPVPMVRSVGVVTMRKGDSMRSGEVPGRSGFWLLDPVSK